MTDGLKFSKRLTTDAEEVVIRAQVQERGGSRWHAVTFEKSRVDYIVDVADGVSGIALKTGAKIPVAMPYEELERKIYFSDAGETPVLNLREVTGPAAQAALGDARLPELAEDFEAASPKTGPKTGAEAAAAFPEKRPMVDKPLKIAVFVRQPSEQNFQMFFFMDSNIEWERVTGEEGKNGKLTKLPLRFGKGPFNEDAIILDMPRPAFMDIYNRAKMEGLEELDLREWTRRRDPTNTQSPAAGPK